MPKRDYRYHMLSTPAEMGNALMGIEKGAVSKTPNSVVFGVRSLTAAARLAWINYVRTADCLCEYII